MVTRVHGRQCQDVLNANLHTLLLHSYNLKSGGIILFDRYLQVFEERREERKRALDATDEMDRGRTKKIKFHHYNRFNNNRNVYNPFQVLFIFLI